MANQPVPWDDNSDEEDMDAREPWMWGGRNAYVFLIDVSEPMFTPDIKNSSHFKECIKACKKIMLTKIIQEEKDLIGIVLYGTMHKDQKGQPNHVMTLQEIDYPSAERLQALLKIEEDPDEFERTVGHSKDFCIGDALWHCNKLINNCKIKLAEKSILIMTSNDNPHSTSPSLQTNACKRANDLRHTKVSLRVFPLGLSFNLQSFYQELIDNAHGDDSVTSIVFESVDDILQSFERSVSKRSIGKLKWDLGKNVSLAVGVYTICRAASMPKKVKIERTKNELVQSRSQYFNANTGEEVLRTDIVRSAKIANETVVYEADEALAVKQVVPPGLVLLGFKPIETIRIYFHWKTPLFIYPEERKIIGSRTLFAALHIQCLKRRYAALCFYTARRSSRPELVALVPQEEKLGRNNVQLIPPGFVLVFLPFADNIRDLEKQAVQCPDPNPQLVDIAERIIKGIAFDYDPHAIDNPRLSTHWAGIEALALKYSDFKVPIDHTLPDNKSIDEEIGELACSFMDLAFPEGYSEKHITSAVKAKHSLAGKGTSNSKKAKVELDPDNMEDIARENNVEKLKVDQLKAFLVEKGYGKVSKMKKNELVKAVYSHFDIDQPS